MTAREHLSGETLERLGNAAWRGEERDSAVAHLAECAACRRRLIERRRASPVPTPVRVPAALRRRVDELVPRRRRTAPRLAFAAATAVLLLTVVFNVLLRSGGPDPVTAPREVMRGQAGPSWMPEEPEEGEELAREGPDPFFRWSEIDGAVSYRLVIQGPAGERLLALETKGTKAPVPWTALGVGARSYFVEAKLADGSSRRSRAVDFSVVP